MKSWTVSDDVKSDPQLYAAVEALKPALERVVGPRFAPDIRAKWRSAPGGVGLWLADDAWPDGVETVIPTRDLTPGGESDYWLRRAMIAMHEPGTRALLDGIWASLEVTNA